MGAHRVLLIGMMGAGKSTVGRMLADRQGWPYWDSDEQVEAHTGHTVPEIFAARGEAAFRAEEALALVEATTGDGPAVLSVAGGARLGADNRQRIKRAGLGVWLPASVATRAGPGGSGPGPPAPAGGPGARP